MAFQLKYSDKYHLWWDLVRGRMDRVFLQTPERVEIGTTLLVELVVPGLRLPVIARATVVGRRPESRRFAGGVYVQLAESELEKCRKLLALDQGDPSRYGAGRKRRRRHCALPARFVHPRIDDAVIVNDISVSGLALKGPTGFAAGQHVVIELLIPAGSLQLMAEVVWTNARQEIGMRFRDLTPPHEQRIVDYMASLGADKSDRHSIVVADDDEDILRLMTTVLEKHGYEIHAASDGSTALKLIREQVPEFVLLDILMRGIDGVDICKLIRADEALADVPVVFISALEASALASVAEEAGASDYMAKPAALADILNMVASYLKP